MKTSIKVRFSASGFGSKIMKFNSIADVIADAECTAGDVNGVVENYGDEIVVQTRDGEEIARWEII